MCAVMYVHRTLGVQAIVTGTKVPKIGPIVALGIPSCVAWDSLWAEAGALTVFGWLQPSYAMMHPQADIWAAASSLS